MKSRRGKSMARRLAALMAMLSLLLCIAAVAMWVRSYRLGDNIFRWHDKLYWSFASEQGTVISQKSWSSPDGRPAAPQPAGPWKHYSFRAYGDSPSTIRTAFGDGVYQLLGVQFHR